MDMKRAGTALAGVRGIVFDKDGTLFDFNATWAVWTAELIADIGTTSDARAALAEVLGFDIPAGTFRPGSIVIAETVSTIATRLAPYFPGQSTAAIAAQLNARAARTAQSPVIPLAPFLQTLRAAGLRLGVATNDGEVPARAHLAGEGIGQLFDFVAGYDSGHGGKPGPGQLQAFAAAMALAPQECVMVGDSLHDLHAGRAAGMRCVAVLTGVASRDVLEPQADLTLASISDLPAALGL